MGGVRETGIDVAMTKKSVLIIGAGVGCLSTGCYAQMNGYDVRILEMHKAPGGQCTACSVTATPLTDAFIILRERA